MSDLPDRTTAATTMISEAAALRETVGDTRTTVALDAIGGRRLAESIVASTPQPRRDYATMDGFAVATADAFPLSVRERRVTPDDDPVDHDPGTATPITTGAPLPCGADAVIPSEDARVDDGIVRGPHPDSGQHVLRRGSYYDAGETVLGHDAVLAARDSTILRDIGRERVLVREPFSVGVVPTGDEVAAGVQPDRVSDAVAGLVHRWGQAVTIEDPISDDPTVLRDRLSALATDYDVLVTSGGTSVGSRDYTVGALADLGTVVQRGMALRPGRPVACVRLDDYDAVGIALPGKPVAAYVSTLAVVGPFFNGSQARPWRTAVAAHDLSLPDTSLEYALPVTVTEDTMISVGSPASDVTLYQDCYRPGRVAACPRVLRADGLAFRTKPLVAGERIRWTPFPSLEAQ